MDRQTFRLVIANPCSEDWNSMLPSEKGKYCLSCRKSVIDFSAMADKDVIKFFLNNHDQPVCGRFRKEQLDNIRIYLPENIFQRKIPKWKKFLAALLICFSLSLFSFEVVCGNPPFQNEQSQQPIIKVRKSSLNDRKTKLKVKIKEKKLENIVYQNQTIDIEEKFIAGFTQPVPCMPAKNWIELTLSDNLPIYAENNNSDSSDTTISTDINNKPKENQPKRDKSAEKIEFILPAPLRIKRRIIKK